MPYLTLLLNKNPVKGSNDGCLCDPEVMMNTEEHMQVPTAHAGLTKEEEKRDCIFVCALA